MRQTKRRREVRATEKWKQNEKRKSDCEYKERDVITLIALSSCSCSCDGWLGHCHYITQLCVAKLRAGLHLTVICSRRCKYFINRYCTSICYSSRSRTCITTFVSCQHSEQITSCRLFFSFHIFVLSVVYHVSAICIRYEYISY